MYPNNRLWGSDPKGPLAAILSLTVAKGECQGGGAQEQGKHTVIPARKNHSACISLQS